MQTVLCRVKGHFQKTQVLLENSSILQNETRQKCTMLSKCDWFILGSDQGFSKGNPGIPWNQQYSVYSVPKMQVQSLKVKLLVAIAKQTSFIHQHQQQHKHYIQFGTGTHPRKQQQTRNIN